MTTKNAGEMTVEECRNWLAVNYGWTKHDDGWRHPPAERAPRGWDQRSTAGYWASHPIGQTLDEAAKVEGFDAMEVRVWPKDGAHAQIVHCIAYKGDDKHDSRRRGILAKASGTTELEARFRLRVAVEKAERSKA